MKRFGWIGAALIIVVSLVIAETAVITNASGYDSKEKVVFTRTSISKNTILSADMLEIREIGSEAVHPDALGNIGEAVGKRATADMAKGEMLLEGRLSSEGRDIIKAEDKSKRLFSAELKADQANAWQFSEGQFVDIIYVPNHAGANERPPEAEGVTDALPASSGVKLMKNILVAGLIDEDGQLLSGPESGEIPKYVSFEVTQEQAAFLAYAKSNGKIEISCVPDE